MALNYLIDIENAVIVDVEATPARTYDEVAATQTMLERTEERFDLKPKRLAADTAYVTGKILGWLVKERKSLRTFRFGRRVIGRTASSRAQTSSGTRSVRSTSAPTANGFTPAAPYTADEHYFTVLRSAIVTRVLAERVTAAARDMARRNMRANALITG
jgi:hypothetical protein